MLQSHRTFIIAAALLLTHLSYDYGYGSNAHAKELRIATLAPPGSVWMKVLERGAQKTAKGTQNRVTVKFYPGGVMGDEAESIRKVRLGQIDGAGVTTTGLSTIDSSIRVLELPMLFQSIEEMTYVSNRMWPYFQKKFRKKGFKLGPRSEIGWIHFLGQKPVGNPTDMRKLKAWFWKDDQIVRAMYKKLGIQGVPLGLPEVLAALSTGQVEAAYASPVAAVALQWNTKVKYISEASPVYGIGGTISRLDFWKDISPKDKKFTDDNWRRTAAKLRRSVQRDNRSALTQLLRKGVRTSPISPEEKKQFQITSEQIWKDLAGSVYSERELKMVLKLRENFRNKNSK